MRRTVIVNFVHERDRVIRGVLWRARGAWFEIRQAEALRPPPDPRLEPEWIPLSDGGELVIPRSNVAFLQVVADMVPRVVTAS